MTAGSFQHVLGRGVFMDQALSLLPADYWRWWLLSPRARKLGCRIHMGEFPGSVNKDLADVLGNLASRVTKFCRAKFGEVVPEGGAYGPREAQLIADLTTRLRAIRAAHGRDGNPQIRAELRAFWVLGNEYLQDAAPWSSFKTDPDAAAAQIRLALNLIRVYAIVSRARSSRMRRPA